MNRKSFLLVTVNGVRKVRPIEDADLAPMIERGEVREINRRLWEPVGKPSAKPAPEAVSSEYGTKVMTAAPRKRGRPRKAAP